MEVTNRPVKKVIRIRRTWAYTVEPIADGEMKITVYGPPEQCGELTEPDQAQTMK